MAAPSPPSWLLILLCLLLTSCGAASAIISSPDAAAADPISPGHKSSSGSSSGGGGGGAARPNIIFVITDDQDWTLAQWQTVPVVKDFIVEQGVTMSNYFPATPICCPSRSEMLSGRFAHNIRDDHFEDDWDCNFPGHNCGCMRMNTSEEFHQHNFGVYLQKAGYNTAWFGKYLNWQGIKNYCKVNGTGNPIPPGWNKAHFYCNDSYGLEGIWWHNDGELYFSKEYSTAVMGNASLSWLNAQLTKSAEPFFMAIGPHAPHEPYTPAPWYANATIPNIPYPVYPWFDYAAKDHVDWIAALPALTSQQITNAHNMWQQRFRALMQVDDIIKGAIQLLEKFGALDNTFVFFTSDHGHHLGEFHLPEGKSHPYDFDIRVPFAVRGPGLPKNKTLPILTSNVDLGPTFLEIAGVQAPPQMDGQSFAQYLLNPSIWADDSSAASTQTHQNDILEGGEQHQDGVVQDRKSKASWNREALIVEYYPIRDWPANYQPGVSSINDCPNNTWRALRFINSDYGNLLYAEYTAIEDWFFRKVNFYELYDVDKDPYQLHNIYYKSTTKLQQQLHDLMTESFACGGSFTTASNCTRPFPQKSILAASQTYNSLMQ